MPMTTTSKEEPASLMVGGHCVNLPWNGLTPLVMLNNKPYAFNLVVESSVTYNGNILIAFPGPSFLVICS